MEFGNNSAVRAEKKGKKLPVFKFLGFLCYWGKAKQGFWRLKYASLGNRIRNKLKGLHNYLMENQNTENQDRFLKRVNSVIRGWINYHAVSDNNGCVWEFVNRCKHILFKWFNRRGSRRSMTWERFAKVLKAINFPENWKTKSMFSSSSKQV